jgi:hypothetical protein
MGQKAEHVQLFDIFGSGRMISVMFLRPSRHIFGISSGYFEDSGVRSPDVRALAYFLQKL